MLWEQDAVGSNPILPTNFFCFTIVMTGDIEKYRGKKLSCVPSGYTPFLLSDLIKTSKQDILYVASSSQELEDVARVFQTIMPSVDVLMFPAWDTVPYDRVSPNSGIVGVRLETLCELALKPTADKPRLIVASVGSVLQKLPPKKIFLNARRTFEVGGKFDFNDFLHYVAINGYTRVEQVMEPAEYAVRGDIIDIFPVCANEPIRIDLFDDVIENIRVFNPISQRTTGTVKSYRFGIGDEVVLDEHAVQNFRAAYCEAFGAASVHDELYESISNGAKYIGYENWLPFFYDEPLLTLFDYVPRAHIVLGQHTKDAIETKTESIYDYYMARTEALKTLKSDETAYRPVKPDSLYLTKEEFELRTDKAQAVRLSELSEPDQANVVNLNVLPGRDFAHALHMEDVYGSIKDYLTENGRLNRMICFSSQGVCEKFMSIAREYGFSDIMVAKTFDDAVQICSHKKIALVILNVSQGFKTSEFCVVSEVEIFGERQNRRARKIKAEDFISDVSSLNVGELVVHTEHGVGRFEGLENLLAGGAPHDCLRILYANNDKLFVPVENIELISRYGSDDENIALDTLGGMAWQAKKAKAKEKIKEIAEDLIKVAAERELKTADCFIPPQGLYDDFCARFVFHETQDQKKAIADVLQDLNAGMPMDRLICGDVGFGKTEVALRAAFVAASNGAQTAVVVPTTLLARQHYLNFKSRFEGFGIKVKMLSRLTSAKETRETIEGLKNGSIEIVIGTHALLSENVKFCNLGLLIIDEEQHFGVSHKEKLKSLKTDVHVLTLSATPIPRTLQLSLTGVKNLSIIATPPVDRIAARTFVMPFDKVMIKEAILREKYRGGQTFFVCPRVSDIDDVYKILSNLVPEVKIGVAHGQMRPKDLEDVMSAFANLEYDVLVSTTIIESGIDMPTVNTMIVYRSDMFGLAQLYQLKGRIGRSKIRGYCYFTVPEKKKLKETALRRLNILSALDTLGAGFSLASHDMDIRGSGNVLGTEQSGHIKDVGIGLYQHMLQEEIARQKAMAAHQTQNESENDDFSPQIITGIPIMIGENYVKDLGVRLGLYKRIGNLRTKDEILDMKAELVDRFGPIPSEVENLLEIIEIKQLCKEANIAKLEAGAKGLLIGFNNNVFDAVGALLNLVQRSFGVMQIRPDQKLFVSGDLSDYNKRVAIIKKYVIMLKDLLQTNKT